MKVKLLTVVLASALLAAAPSVTLAQPPITPATLIVTAAPTPAASMPIREYRSRRDRPD